MPMQVDQTEPEENAMNRSGTLEIEREVSFPLADQKKGWALPGENPPAPQEIPW